ncbi:uncharacterized protein LOC110466874 [Mizuhopecten yessoensis]|uniref:Cyclic GMP-AMP synthase n=1 Tax=Mizuhopecten yessoensis TaxID=6573 RepID=A0A210PNC3_MIZYE|nr:uncharacterized protein LOC110466874 [Mizuhopecten yessoensis]XP_021379356.1 uncharacterized protein LOC110466874 [Mizuhopecten yessoensis]OWF37963.1 Cyclic GMP-AMP synthase [Mizuhopecten yessoensis]
MSDQDELYQKSWILHHVLDRLIGSREEVAIRRRMIFIREYIERDKTVVEFNTGSMGEGVHMNGSDVDIMQIDNNVIVICPDQHTSVSRGRTDKTILIMRASDSRPGYVNLELDQRGQISSELLVESIVRDGNKLFISSEKFARTFAKTWGLMGKVDLENKGPAASMDCKSSYLPFDVDLVRSFPCSSWPKEANEWLSRPRFYEWPNKALRDQIEQGGCHLVPVGDKTSAGSCLQWRISFTTAERKLMYSFTHQQFLVYGLLKFFLKQISESLKGITADVDLLTSYIMKTVIFHALEQTPTSLWQEKNTFICFMICLNILIAWVKAGYCPNYFISRNNMFSGKVQGRNQRILLRWLIMLHDLKWECLSGVTHISIVMRMRLIISGKLEYMPPPKQLERERDMLIFEGTVTSLFNYDILPKSLALLARSTSDLDKFVTLYYTVQALSYMGMDTFEEHTSARGNKEKYKSFRKSKNLLTPLASACKSPGQLMLATYYYQTGNYMRTLELCGHMISSFTIYIGECSEENGSNRYEQHYCGHGYTLLDKCQKTCVSDLRFLQNNVLFCPSQLHPEMTKVHDGDVLVIPPLPYAVFLSFLCYYELGDTRRRDTALTRLRVVTYDAEQGGGQHWIVHNLLGICYEMIGDTSRAFREYKNSLGGRRQRPHYNPSEERMERLQNSKYN